MKGIKRIISAVASAVMAFSVIAMPQNINTNAVYKSYEYENIQAYDPSSSFNAVRIMSEDEITLYKRTNQDQKHKITIGSLDVHNVIDEEIYKDLGIDGLPIGMYQDSVGPVIELWYKDYTNDEINNMWPQFQKYARDAKNSSEIDFPSTYKTKITGDVARSMQKVSSIITYKEIAEYPYNRTDYVPQDGEKYDLLNGDFQLMQVENPYDTVWWEDYPDRYLKLKEDGSLEFYKNPGIDTMTETMWIHDLKTHNVIAFHVIIHAYAAHYGRDAYINDTIDEFVANNFTPGMTEFEKMDAVMKWFAKDFDYYNGAASEYDVWLTGRGDCWAFPEALSRVCDRIGIKCRTKTAHNETGCSPTHEHSIVELDGRLYIADRGYEGHTYSLKTIEEHYKNGAGANAYDGNWKVIETDDEPHVWGGLVAGNGIVITRYFGFEPDVVVPETMTIKGHEYPILYLAMNTFNLKDYDKTHQEIVNSAIIPNNVLMPFMAYQEDNRHIYMVRYDGTPVECISAGTGIKNDDGVYIEKQLLDSGWGNNTGLSKKTALWWMKWYDYEFPVPVDYKAVLRRELIVGDLNKDKRVDAFDMVLMRQALINGYDEESQTMGIKLDINNDDTFGIADAVALQKFLLGCGTIG